MILYVNGDSHTAAAEAVKPYIFANDDNPLFYLGHSPHPENLSVSWGKLLSLALRCGFCCNAEGASSNDRILKTTRAWLSERKNNLEDIIVVIQWASWGQESIQEIHDNIWQLHQDLLAQNISHVFFNSSDNFSSITNRKDWGISYIGPYDPNATYNAQICAAGFETVAPNSDHFGKDAHSWWFKHILNYIMTNKFI